MNKIILVLIVGLLPVVTSNMDKHEFSRNNTPVFPKLMPRNDTHATDYSQRDRRGVAEAWADLDECETPSDGCYCELFGVTKGTSQTGIVRGEFARFLQNAVRYSVYNGKHGGVNVTNLEEMPNKVTTSSTGTFKVKAGLAQMAKGGIIMDVTTPAEARIAEEAGACAVMALERVPADIRRDGGVARMSDPQMITDIINAVTIPVMAKARIGHFAEAQILEALGVDMVDESEVLTPADEENHINKHNFKVPFVCGARDLGEALRRIAEGAAMIRTKGLAGTGDVGEAVRHARTINRQIKIAQALDSTELYNYAKELRVPIDLLQKTAELGRLPVVNFAAGGIATPADVSLMMQLGVDGVFVGSGIFKSSDPPSRAVAMAGAVTQYKDPKMLAQLSSNLGKAMFGVPRSEAEKEGKEWSSSTKGGTQEIWNSTLGDPSTFPAKQSA